MAVSEDWNTVDTLAGSKQTSYSGLQQVDNDHERRLEEGQSSKDNLGCDPWLVASTNS